MQRACQEVGIQAEITGDPSRIQAAERIIFPGVGIAAAAMKSIKARGIDNALISAFNAGTPILGICIGLQISLDHSEEGDTETLGLIAGRVRRFQMSNLDLKVPHMGWNEVNIVKPHPVLKHVKRGDEFYFVHAYFPDPIDDEVVCARATYEAPFCCAIAYRNFVGTQFHPEKSGRVGLQLIRNFSEWNGRRA